MVVSIFPDFPSIFPKNFARQVLFLQKPNHQILVSKSVSLDGILATP